MGGAETSLVVLKLRKFYVTSGDVDVMMQNTSRG